MPITKRCVYFNRNKIFFFKSTKVFFFENISRTASDNQFSLNFFSWVWTFSRLDLEILYRPLLKRENVTQKNSRNAATIELNKRIINNVILKIEHFSLVRCGKNEENWKKKRAKNIRSQKYFAIATDTKFNLQAIKKTFISQTTPLSHGDSF